MRVLLIYDSDCPHWPLARDRLNEAIRISGVGSIAVRLIESSHTHHDAAATAHGSPTILIDGVDPFPTDRRGSSGHCRLYTTACGFEGAPSVDQLVEALRRTGRSASRYDATEDASFPASDSPQANGPGLIESGVPGARALPSAVSVRNTATPSIQPWVGYVKCVA